jgi:hypothetical protein
MSSENNTQNLMIETPHNETNKDVVDTTHAEDSIHQDEFLAAHEDVFKSRQAMRINETKEEYDERIQGMWDNRRAQLLAERTPDNTSTVSEVEPSVARWLSHPKIEEYARRYKAGESIDLLLQGQKDIEEKRLAIEMLAPTLVDESATAIIAEGALVPEVEDILGEGGQESQGPIIDPRFEKLKGWSASYELARVAQNEGVDLTTLTREDYAAYAIDHGLAVDDSQLRAANWQRMETSPENIIKKRQELERWLPEEIRNAFDEFSRKTLVRAGQENREIAHGVRVRQGTKDSNSWLFFGINNGTGERGEETYKSYLTFKDLSTFTPTRFIEYLEALQDAGYNGDVKTFQELEQQGLALHDQVVMHGASAEDATLAAQVAEQYFGNDLAEVSSGRDAVGEDGKEYSYSQLLSQHIASAVGEKYRQFHQLQSGI